MLFEKKRWRLFSDPQVKGFLWVVTVTWLVLAAVRINAAETSFEVAIRQTLFNSVSIMTGTGYASTDYTRWGAFAIIVFFVIGLIGGCAGSTCCSVKIFRYQVLTSVALGELQKIRRPRSIVIIRYGGRKLDDRVVTSVLTFMSVFFLTLFIMTAALTVIGLDVTTALTGAATALANIGPGFGDTIGPVGSFAELPEAAKIVLIFGMILGRLELLSVLVLFTPGFWRR
jgi:trk system potassium uptake protein TrkH